MISVITRTKDRAFFLPRLFESLKKQTYRPIEWIIVNDAGENIDLFIADFKQKADADFLIKYISKETSTTMEAATNVGLQNATGKFINILDDDDTIKSNFYHDSITYLEQEKYPTLKGVISYAQYIYEEIDTDKNINFLRKADFPMKPQSLTLPLLFEKNQFPIHSFVYYKEVLEKISLYDESLPVLGDWEFNMRFIKTFDIGIIPNISVNYHQREDTQYGNTVRTQLDDHHKYEALIRNKILRQETQNPLISTLMGQSTNSKIIEESLDFLKKSIDDINAQSIQDKIAIIQRKNEDLKAKDDTIGQKNQIILAKDTIIQRKNEDLSAKDDTIGQKNQIILAKDTIIQKKNEDLSAKDDTIGQKNQIILAKDKDLKTKDDTIGQKNQIILAKDATIHKKSEEIEHLKEELAIIYSGKSWQMTRVIRNLKKIIKG